MPNWGLTEEQQNSEPWGLKARLLKPAKTITDPVHGDVYLNELELSLLDSPALQRLRRVRQLGTTHFVYPGATHSRLSHALGALRAAQDLMDAVVGNRESPRHTPDLLDAWHAEGGPANVSRRLAEATVLARLGALLHDLCHVPFGHTIEDELKMLVPHDKNAARFERLWSQLPADALAALRHDRAALETELRHLVLSKEGRPDRWASRYPFVFDIVGNTICADLLDYLCRDHLFTGLPMAVGDRFADDFYVVGPDHVFYPAQMAIRVTRNTKVRADIVTELLKYLRYRYELSERALYHHAKVAVDAMIGKLLEMWRDTEWAAEAVRRHPRLASRDSTDVDALAVELRPRAVQKIDLAVQAQLDEEFTRWSDDGLLEHLLSLSEERGEQDKRWAAMGELARGVLDRQLFKQVGWANGPDARAVADKLYDAYSTPDARRRIEREAAFYAGLERRFHVVLWVPNPDMKLKVADVLVDADGEIMPLSRYNRSGDEIVEAHRNLWGIGIYAHETVRDDDRQRDALLAFMSERMGVAFRRNDGEEALRPAALAVARVAEARRLTADRRAQLAQLVPAAMGSPGTFAALEESVHVVAEANRLGRKPRAR